MAPTQPCGQQHFLSRAQTSFVAGLFRPTDLADSLRRPDD